MPHRRILLALEVFGGNPDELRILLACAERASSAAEVAETKAEVAKVSYHFRKMAEDGYIRFVREERRRGAIAKFYVITAKGKRLLRSLGLAGLPSIADTQADVERRYAETNAGVYDGVPDAEDWQRWTDGVDLDQAEVIEAGLDYYRRWAEGHDVPVQTLVQGAYVSGVHVGERRYARRP